jgi:hypothetical protein
MNIVQISNLFNQVCIGINQQTAGRIGFYHYGWYSDINANITNNWTGNNALGRVYPAVQLMYPTANIEIKEKSVKGTLQCRMVISKQQYYDNQNQYVNQSIVEAQAELEALAVNILSEYNRVARLPANKMQTGIQSPIRIDYLSDAHNENLVLLDIGFTIWYVWECPTDTVDIAALPDPYDDLPPITTDLEKEQAISEPLNKITPIIDYIGIAPIGGTLKVIDNGTWSGTLPITFTYQWKQNSIDIVGQTNDVYSTQLIDIGQTITCEVTAINIIGSSSAISNSILVV